MTTAFKFEHGKRIRRPKMYGAYFQHSRRFSIPSRTNGTVALSLVTMIRPTTNIFLLQRFQFQLQAVSFLRMLLHQHLLYLYRTRSQCLWTLMLSLYLTVLQFQLQVSFLRVQSHQPLLSLKCTRSQCLRIFSQMGLLWTSILSC